VRACVRCMRASARAPRRRRRRGCRRSAPGTARRGCSCARAHAAHTQRARTRTHGSQKKSGRRRRKRAHARVRATRRARWRLTLATAHPPSSTSRSSGGTKRRACGRGSAVRTDQASAPRYTCDDKAVFAACAAPLPRCCRARRASDDFTRLSWYSALRAAHAREQAAWRARHTCSGQRCAKTHTPAACPVPWRSAPAGEAVREGRVVAAAHGVGSARSDASSAGGDATSHSAPIVLDIGLI
jgi:hypothetical protein